MSSRVLGPMIAAGVLMLTTGCATVLKGSTQTVPVASDPPSADVLVDGALVGQTPTTIALKRKTPHLVTLQKQGYESKSISVQKNIGGAVFGNIILGGLIGWGVDAATGAQYNLNPNTISVRLDPSTVADAKPVEVAAAH